MTPPQDNSNHFGQALSAWLKRLPSVAERLLTRPGLDVLPSFIGKLQTLAAPTAQLSLRVHPPRSDGYSNDHVTVLSTNLWHDWPRHRQQMERLERLANLVESEGVDIVLLQEVWRTPDVQVDHWLSQRLGMTSVYSRANGGKTAIGFEEGPAILSHFPLLAPRWKQLGSTCRQLVTRLALSADASTPGGRLALFSVHLGFLPHNNARQLAHLASWVDALAHDRPALIGGDFNAHESSRRIKQAQRNWLDTFRHLHPQADGVTHEIRACDNLSLSRRRLDYIFLKSHRPRWQITEARHVAAPGGSHSDHLAVLLRLKCEAHP